MNRDVPVLPEICHRLGVPERKVSEWGSEALQGLNNGSIHEGVKLLLMNTQKVFAEKKCIQIINHMLSIKIDPLISDNNVSMHNNNVPLDSSCFQSKH